MFNHPVLEDHDNRLFEGMVDGFKPIDNDDLDLEADCEQREKSSTPVVPTLTYFDVNEYKRIKTICENYLYSLRKKNPSFSNIKAKFKDALNTYSEFLLGQKTEEEAASEIKRVPNRFKELFEIHKSHILIPILFQIINNYKSLKPKNDLGIGITSLEVPSESIPTLSLSDENKTSLHNLCCIIMRNNLKRTSFTEASLQKIKSDFVNAVTLEMGLHKDIVAYLDKFKKTEVKEFILHTIENYKPYRQFPSLEVTRDNSETKLRPRKSKVKASLSISSLFQPAPQTVTSNGSVVSNDMRPL